MLKNCDKQFKFSQFLGRPQGGQNGHLPPPGNLDEEPKISRKPEGSSFVSIISLTAYLRHLK